MSEGTQKPQGEGQPTRSAAPPPRTIRRSSPDYPAVLAELDDAPAILHVRGCIPDAPAIAIVGSRDCTAYGRRIAYRIAADVVRAGFVVVSGLARGVDAAAHLGALDGGGLTVAVLPCGIDRVYPLSHWRLAARIEHHGALVTEFEPGSTVTPWSFPQRNRIIAGLGIATLVVEAAVRSGTTSTVNFALDYGRDVLAVPGPVGSPTSEGANAMIATGAGVCRGIDSLVEYLREPWASYGRAHLQRPGKADTAARQPLDDAARRVLEALRPGEVCSVDALAHATAMPVGELLAALTELEARGLLRSAGNQRYERL